MKNLTKTTTWILGVLYILSVISNIDGFLNFVGKITKTQMDTIILILQILYKIISISFPFLIGFCIYKILDLKEKLIALKTYRDIEAIRTTNQYNANFNLINEQIKELYKKCYGKIETEPIDVINEKNKIELQNLYDISVDNYNNAFKDWELGNYGENNLKTIK